MKGLMSKMNRFCFKTTYDVNKIIKTIRRIYYGEERINMIIINSFIQITTAKEVMTA